MIIHSDNKIGENTIVFLHGWCGNHKTWQYQTNFFQQSNRVIILEWDKLLNTDRVYSKDIFDHIGKEFINLCTTHHIENPILVGHSLGGTLALYLNNLMNSTKGIVIVDTSLPLPAERKKSYISLSKKISKKDGDKVLKEIFWTAFVDTNDRKEIMERQLQIMLEQDRKLASMLLGQSCKLPQAHLLQKVTCPSLYIGASNPKGNFQQINKLNPKIQTSQVVGSGHYIMLNVPDQFNAMLKHFIEVNFRTT